MDFKPVCARWLDQTCEGVPCYKYKTYSNSCEACHNKFIISYTNGACKPAKSAKPYSDTNGTGAEAVVEDEAVPLL